MTPMSASTPQSLGTSPTVSTRITAVQDPVIPIVGELTKAHPGTISLGQGVVSYSPPPEAQNKLAAFFAEPDNHKYKLVQGIPELLEAIRSKLVRDNQFELSDSERIVVTAGSNMGFNNALLAIADPGDEIIIPVPYYFNHEMAIRMANCHPVAVPTDQNFQLDLDAIKDAVTNRTRAIVTISPNNPSGAVYPKETLLAINRFCQENGLYHISDEAYEYFTYGDARHFSPGSIPGSDAHTISLYSLSKAYGFASWRIGYMVVPQHLLAPIKKIQDTILICPPVISQYAAWGAISAGSTFWQPHVANLASTRRAVIEALSNLEDSGTFNHADGAFYFLVKLATAADPMDVIRHLVTEHRVAAIPGTAFGLRDGCHLRIAYAALPEEPLLEGIERFTTGVKSYLQTYKA